MRKIYPYLMAAFFIITFTINVSAKAMAPQVGSVKTFVSEKGNHSVDIKILGYPDRSPSGCTFREENKIIWSKEIPATPGKVNISNNGKFIVMANWGWYDEGGFKSLSFYNNAGVVLGEISFDDKGKDSMVWISKAAISPNGKYYIIGIDGSQKSKLYLYDIELTNLLWSNEYGFENTVEIEISNEGNSILMATSDYNSGNMLFILSDINGKVLWQEQIKNNFSWDTHDYLHFEEDGINFEIFDKTKGEYISYLNENGKITQK